MINSTGLTMTQIDLICANSTDPKQMRAYLTRLQRNQMRVDYDEARVAAEYLEMEQSDAGKADQPKTVSMSLSVCAGQFQGKTTLLLFLLESLADAGILTYADTKKFTEDPWQFLDLSRAINDAGSETLVLDLDLGGVLEALLAGPMSR